MVDPTSQLRIEYLLKRISRSRKGKQFIWMWLGTWIVFHLLYGFSLKKTTKKLFGQLMLRRMGNPLKKVAKEIYREQTHFQPNER